MAALTAYLDDSGDPKDPQHSILTVAGFLSTASGWEWFENHWPKMLAHHKAPYLHMKELWDRDGPFKHIKDVPGAEAAFLSDCTQVIAVSLQLNVSASIKLADLERFNEDVGLDLDPMALAIYGCLIELRAAAPEDEIHIFLDRITKPTKPIELARQYAQSDTYADLKSDHLIITPLPAGDTFRNVFPIQAADFMAWEARRSCEERKTFSPSESDREHVTKFQMAYERWKLAFYLRFNRMPRDRMSARMLTAWPPPRGFLWDYHNIMGAHVNRHKNGWGN